jgi:hypothetical protein
MAIELNATESRASEQTDARGKHAMKMLSGLAALLSLALFASTAVQASVDPTADGKTELFEAIIGRADAP